MKDHKPIDMQAIIKREKAQLAIRAARMYEGFNQITDAVEREAFVKGISSDVGLYFINLFIADLKRKHGEHYERWGYLSTVEREYYIQRLLLALLECDAVLSI